MEDRKRALLSSIIKEHINNAEPVGSRLLVDKYGLGVSPATVRNDMMALEKEGFITHLHTSGGRIPTEKGWKYYLDNFVVNKEVSKREYDFLKLALADRTDISEEMTTKRLAKALAELSQEAVIVGFSPDIYYTGISYLFSHPEFHEFNLISRMSEVIDHLDEVMHDLFPAVEDDVRVLVGEENPFGKQCGVMVVKYHAKNGEQQMVGILGPMRMDYESHMSRLQCVRTLLENTEHTP